MHGLSQPLCPSQTLYLLHLPHLQQYVPCLPSTFLEVAMVFCTRSKWLPGPLGSSDIHASNILARTDADDLGAIALEGSGLENETQLTRGGASPQPGGGD